MTSVVTFERPDGILQIQELGNGRRKLLSIPSAPDPYTARRSCVTTYPPELVSFFLESTGVAGVCEVIARDSDPSTVSAAIRHLTFAYCDPQQLQGARVLDFGCGGGASSVALAGLLAKAEVVGVDLLERKLRLARARAQHHGLKNVRFAASPSGGELPANIGQFDFVYLFAVYEHLLPHERPTVMRLIWSALKPGGVLFLTDTPHRYFPIELHSTRLPLINYLPDSVAHFAVRKFALAGGKVNKSVRWEDHLRGGIRGGTEREILSHLKHEAGMRPKLLEPGRLGVRDRCDFWYAKLSPRYRPLKKIIREGLRALYYLSGTVLAPNLTMAVQKQSDENL